MPTYTYVCELEHLTDRVSSMDNARKWVKCLECGKRARRDFGRVIGIAPSSNWPQTSVAMGVQPEQREEATKDARSRGVPTEFNLQGDAVFTSRAHRRDFLKAYHAHDHDGGYGD